MFPLTLTAIALVFLFHSFVLWTRNNCPKNSPAWIGRQTKRRNVGLDAFE